MPAETTGWRGGAGPAAGSGTRGGVELVSRNISQSAPAVASGVLSASLFAVCAMWQCDREDRYLVAQRLVDMSHLLGGLTTVSRNSC